MAEQFLTLTQVEDIMLETARLALEIPDDNSTVRLAYGAGSATGSAPMHDVKQSVVYVTVNPTDDGYGKQHHLSYDRPEGAEMLTEVDEYTEEYAVIFSCYGNAAYEYARKIRDSLYGEVSRKYLKKHKIYFKVGSAQLTPARELFETRWVNRCDVTVEFYATARVERAGAVGWVDRVEINTMTRKE